MFNAILPVSRRPDQALGDFITLPVPAGVLLFFRFGTRPLRDGIGRKGIPIFLWDCGLSCVQASLLIACLTFALYGIWLCPRSGSFRGIRQRWTASGMRPFRLPSRAIFFKAACHWNRCSCRTMPFGKGQPPPFSNELLVFLRMIASAASTIVQPTLASPHFQVPRP